MKSISIKSADCERRLGGWTGWLLERIGKGVNKGLRTERHPVVRLALVDRITLAPRQSLALVEVEGRRFLVATSAEGAPAFCSLDGTAKQRMARVSW
jgi:flagellar biogenesis protein FliO